MGRKAFYVNALHGVYGIYGALTRYSFVIRFGRPPSPVTRFINWGRLLFGWFKFYYGRFVAWGRCQTTQRRRIWGRGSWWGWSGGLHEGYKPNRLKLKCVQIGFDFFVVVVLLMSRLSCAFTFPQHFMCWHSRWGVGFGMSWAQFLFGCDRGWRWWGCIHSRTMNGNRLTAST